MMAPMSSFRAQIAPVRAQIARRVRAELAAAEVTGRGLAPQLELSPHGMSRRLRGEVAFRADELVFIAALLDVPPERFLTGVTARAAAAATTERVEREEPDPPGRRPAMAG